MCEADASGGLCDELKLKSDILSLFQMDNVSQISLAVLAWMVCRREMMLAQRLYGSDDVAMGAVSQID